MLHNPFRSLDDQALTKSLLGRVRNECSEGVDIILHLMVVLERRMHLSSGCSSLFVYCRKVLGFSKGTASRRSIVAKKAEQFPELLERLRDGRLLLCAAARLARELTAENVEELLTAAEGLSYDEVEPLLVERRADAVETPAEPKAALAFDGVIGSNGTSFGMDLEPPPRPSRPLPRTAIKPLPGQASRLSVSAKKETTDMWQRIKELMPDKTDDERLAAAFDALLDKKAPERRHARREKRKVSSARKPLKTRNSDAHSRRGAQADRDAVTVENDCRCTFVSPEGRRCDERANLQIDHKVPWAVAHNSGKDNLRPMCAAHNRHLAELQFGPPPSRATAISRRGS